MNRKHLNASTRRSGFTLIELLVVIAIIAVLAALLLGGVIVFFRKGPEVKTRNDILQLNQALQKFKTDYGRYPPSQIRLRANLKDYLPAAQGGNRVDALDDASSMWLATMFKSLGGTTNIPWAGATAMPAGGVILEGDQCLVFFLGGPPVGGATGAQAGLMGGFTVDPLNPVNGGGQRKKYMDFDTGRLINRGGNPFPSYVDSFDKQQPFVYFSSNGFISTPSGGRYGSAYESNFFTGPNVVQATNTLGVKPYLQPGTAKFALPDSYQIISAGRDGAFGPGGAWTPGAGAWISGGPGFDDFSNFSDKALGIQ